VGVGRQSCPVVAPEGGGVLPATECWCCCACRRTGTSGGASSECGSGGAGAVPDLRLRRRQATIPEAPHWIRYGWRVLPVFPGILGFSVRAANSAGSIYYFSVPRFSGWKSKSWRIWLEKLYFLAIRCSTAPFLVACGTVLSVAMPL
jgi:hypothetical protein